MREEYAHPDAAALLAPLSPWAQRYFSIALAHLPPGWTFSFRSKSLTGCCCWKRKHIEAPRPVTRRALHVWLHECAHAEGIGKGQARHVEEMLVEKRAHRMMRAAGVPVSKKSLEEGKRHVAWEIVQAERAGAKISAEAVRYAGQRQCRLYGVSLKALPRREDSIGERSRRLG